MAWINFVLYEMVWFASVMGASHGAAWPAGVATLLFGAWRLTVSQNARAEIRLVVVGVLLGFLFDGALVRSGLVAYAAPWPAGMAPAWILALWAAFALSVVPLLGYLHTRPWLATAFGAAGGPLAYLGAARGWAVIHFAEPMWHPLLALALGWGAAMPLLSSLAHHWLLYRPTAARSMP